MTAPPTAPPTPPASPAPPTTAQAVAEIRALLGLTVTELQARHAQVLGRESRSRNGTHLRAVLAAHLARQVAPATPAERRALARAVKAAVEGPRRAQVPPTRDPRIPPPGTVLRRRHGGEEIEVRVLREGFAFRGRTYPSLSAVAREVTGARWNGLLWLGLARRARGRRTT
jgi:hypothetical protein